MKELNFNENRFRLCDRKDLMNFVTDLSKEYKFQDKKVYASDYELGQTDAGCDTMTTAKITFQVWDDKQGGLGTKYQWQCYRAVDHCCSNRQFTLINWTIAELERANQI